MPAVPLPRTPTRRDYISSGTFPALVAVFACNRAGAALAVEERDAMVEAARASVKDLREYEDNASTISSYSEELDKIATRLGVDMKSEIKILQGRADDLETRDADEQDSDPEEVRCEVDADNDKDFDRLFGTLLDR